MGLSPGSGTIHQLRVLCDKIVKNIVRGDINSDGLKLLNRLQGEGGLRRSRESLDHQLDVESESLNIQIKTILNRIDRVQGDGGRLENLMISKLTVLDLSLELVIRSRLIPIYSRNNEKL
jgi:hypothetical protein